jgi:hypothetical protein
MAINATIAARIIAVPPSSSISQGRYCLNRIVFLLRSDNSSECGGGLQLDLSICPQPLRRTRVSTQAGNNITLSNCRTDRPGRGTTN